MWFKLMWARLFGDAPSCRDLHSKKDIIKIQVQSLEAESEKLNWEEVREDYKRVRQDHKIATDSALRDRLERRAIILANEYKRQKISSKKIGYRLERLKDIVHTFDEILRYATDKFLHERYTANPKVALLRNGDPQSATYLVELRQLGEYLDQRYADFDAPLDKIMGDAERIVDIYEEKEKDLLYEIDGELGVDDDWEDEELPEDIEKATPSKVKKTVEEEQIY